MIHHVRVSSGKFEYVCRPSARLVGANVTKRSDPGFPRNNNKAHSLCNDMRMDDVPAAPTLGEEFYLACG